MKKLAMLVVSFILVLSLSSVFATEEENTLLIAPAPEASESGEIVEESISEILSGEDEIATEIENDDEALEVTDEADEKATEDSPVDTTAPETTTTGTTTESNDTNETTTTSSNNGSIVGAIIAVVIVVAVVAIAAILRKD